MELNQLETFLAVAEERSFSALRSPASHQPQSARSFAAGAAVGESLFDRAARDGSLTAAGCCCATMLCAC